MTPSPEAGLRVRALADQAVAAALDADWARALDLNTKILEAAPDDIEARTRLGRALLEQGRPEEAKVAFAEVLKAEPYNSIAIRGAQRVSQLLDHQAKAVMTTTQPQRRLFMGAMAKPGILPPISRSPAHIWAGYGHGSECQLREQEGLVAVHARGG